MIRKAGFYFFASLLCVLLAGVLLIDIGVTEVAADRQVWISIDEQELATLRRELGSGSSKYDIDVSAVNNGIAIARLNSEGIEALSAQMHESFNKCAGFILHNSQEEAYSNVERAFSANTNQRLGSYTIDNQSNVNQMLPETDESKIRQTITDLSAYPTRRHNQPSGLESAQFILDTWNALAAQRADVSAEFFDNTNQGSRSTNQPSVILTIQGTTAPDEVVVLGAHQDSIRSGSQTGLAPGADDDASGIASLTETIRIVVESGFRPQKTIKFMAYAAEEVGLWGSRNIALDFTVNNINVIGVLQLDMTNFTSSSTVDVGLITDSLHTNAAQNQFLRDLIAEYLPNLNVVDTSCGYACSDHASWQENGFPASFPFEAPFGQHNGTLHSGNDVIAQSGGNADHAEKFSKIALTFVGELAKGSIAAAHVAAKFDFDGDSKTDVSVFRPAPGEWWYLRSSDGSNYATRFGVDSDMSMPADFTGDGKADIAFFRPSTSEWFVLRSEDETFYSFPFGNVGDMPSTGDFDGDGKADPAVFRPASVEWFIIRSSDGGTTIQAFGQTGDLPVVADYDGDGNDDIAIYRPSVSEWWQFRSTEGVFAVQFGSAGDQTVPADYTGDGRADIAFWRPSSGFWFVLRSEDSSFFSFPFGLTGDIPAPGDYDGDGVADATVFRPSNNIWYKNQTTSGFEAITFGIADDKPLPHSYVVQ